MRAIGPVNTTDQQKNKQQRRSDENAMSFNRWYRARPANQAGGANNTIASQKSSLNEASRKPSLSVSNMLAISNDPTAARVNKLVSKLKTYEALQRADRTQYGFDFLYRNHIDSVH